MMDQLSGREIVGAYLFLKGREAELDETLSQLLARIEKALFARLSIEEFERLEELYRTGADVFKEEG